MLYDLPVNLKAKAFERRSESMTQDPSGKNIVDLAEARKRQKTVRIDAGGRKVKGASKNGAAPSTPRGGRIWQYVQLAFFLALVAVLMQLCQGGF